MIQSSTNKVMMLESNKHYYGAGLFKNMASIDVNIFLQYFPFLVQITSQLLQDYKIFMKVKLMYWST